MTDNKKENTSNEEQSQYQMRPSIGKSFPVTNVREIINEVLLQILDGKRDYFKIQQRKEFLYQTAHDSSIPLKIGKVYTSGHVGEWCRQIADDINRRITGLATPRYKHIVQVMLAEQTGAGSRFTARCVWDASCDSRVSEQFKSETIDCHVTVFGIYRY